MSNSAADGKGTANKENQCSFLYPPARGSSPLFLVSLSPLSVFLDRRAASIPLGLLNRLMILGSIM
jgi:hypothetical protein